MNDCEICEEKPAVLGVPAFSTEMGTMMMFVCPACAELLDCLPEPADG